METAAGYQTRGGIAGGAMLGGGYAEGAKLADSVRQPEIQSHLQDLFKSVAAFEMVLGELYKKLAPVSRSEPEKELTNAANRGASTELGGQLGDLCARVNNMRNHAQQVTGRIEL